MSREYRIAVENISYINGCGPLADGPVVNVIELWRGVNEPSKDDIAEAASSLDKQPAHDPFELSIGLGRGDLGVEVESSRDLLVQRQRAVVIGQNLIHLGWKTLHYVGVEPDS